MLFEVGNAATSTRKRPRLLCFLCALAVGCSFRVRRRIWRLEKLVNATLPRR